jgi:hypothetical protein
MGTRGSARGAETPYWHCIYVAREGLTGPGVLASGTQLCALKFDFSEPLALKKTFAE